MVHSNLNLLFAHQALFLLKNCLCLPKLLHILRCSPVWKVRWVLQEFDEVDGLSCKFSGGRHSRHSSLNESLKRALTSAQVPAILEPPGIFRKDKRRPDGMTQVSWKNGKELVWQRISIDILRGNCYSVHSTVSDTKGLDEVFYVLNVKKGISV
ncbi:hypothetical protein RvY_10317 [Ramazzottius varieornatus]|uniref:Uncharacterized protein n=1 Tax=Ramazzottius varieornatus TaxID=947166 RepID=A0A1D1VCC4_RAMVA|nr:hypothetical protein RvY_10317 [Ramazzottius varieornatus]